MGRINGILSKLPVSLHDGARIILNAMLTSKDAIGWDSDLRLTVNGRTIHDTNIANLISHVLYPVDPDMDDPIGFKIFVKALHNIGLESEWVENENAKNILDSRKNDEDTTSSSEYETSDDENDQNDGNKNVKKQYKWLSISDDDNEDNSDDEQQSDDNDDNGSDDNDNDEHDGNDNGDNDEENEHVDYEPPFKMKILPVRMNHRLGCNR